MQIDTLKHLAFPPEAPAAKSPRGSLPDAASPKAGAATARAHGHAGREPVAPAATDAPAPSTIVDIGKDRKPMPAAVYSAPRSAQGLAHAAVLRRAEPAPAPAAPPPEGAPAPAPAPVADAAPVPDAATASDAAPAPAPDPEVAPAGDEVPQSATASAPATAPATTPPSPDFVSMAVKAMREFADASEQAKQDGAKAAAGQGALHGVRHLVSKLNVFA